MWNKKNKPSNEKTRSPLGAARIGGWLANQNQAFQFCEFRLRKKYYHFWPLKKMEIFLENFFFIF